MYEMVNILLCSDPDSIIIIFKKYFPLKTFQKVNANLI